MANRIARHDEEIRRLKLRQPPAGNGPVEAPIWLGDYLTTGWYTDDLTDTLGIPAHFYADRGRVFLGGVLWRTGAGDAPSGGILATPLPATHRPWRSTQLVAHTNATDNPDWLMGFELDFEVQRAGWIVLPSSTSGGTGQLRAGGKVPKDPGGTDHYGIPSGCSITLDGLSYRI